MCCYIKRIWAAITTLQNNLPPTYTEGDGIDIAANAIAVDSTVVRTTGAQAIPGQKTMTSPILITPALGTPSAGNLSNTTADGTNKVGTNNIPFTTRDGAAYGVVKADEGHGIRHTIADVTARVWTIGANSVQSWTDGAVLHFRNNFGAGVITIAVTTDTMRLAGAGTTGSRTLAAAGMATAVWDATSSTWLISGSGLT